MDSAIAILALLESAVAAPVELLLWLLRRKLKVSWIYVTFAAMLRGLLYAPAGVGIGHGGLTLPGGMALALRLHAGTGVELAWMWIGAMTFGALVAGIIANRKALFGRSTERA